MLLKLVSRLIFLLQVQQQIAEEYEQVKAITTTLQLFKVDGHHDKPLGKFLET
jgi:hypothetical protein